MAYGLRKVSRVILLVENDSITRTILAGVLRTEGREVLEAGNGEQGLDLLDKNPVDLVITDFVLPGIDGLSLVSRIREGYPQVPIILMSEFFSKPAGDDILSKISGERAMYITKPVRPSALLIAVHDLLSLM